MVYYNKSAKKVGNVSKRQTSVQSRKEPTTTNRSKHSDKSDK